MSKKISQLTQSSFLEVTPDDLILSAGYSLPEALVKEMGETDLTDFDLTGARDYSVLGNHKITVNEFCKYFRNENTYSLKPKFFNYPENNTSKSSNEKLDIADISSLIFNEYGLVTDIVTTSGTNKVTDTIAGTFLSTPPTKQWQGYFDKTIDPVQNATVVGGTIGSWNNLFDKSYSSYKKSIIKYTQARFDSTGNNDFDVCQHEVIIYWDHGGTKSVKACASGQYPAVKGPSAMPLEYNTKTYMINNLFDSIYSSYSKSSSGDYKVLLEIDIENSKINKFPLPSYLGEGGETVSVSMTVESFV